MLSIKQINFSHFSNVLPLLQDMNQELTVCAWKNIFSHNWAKGEGYCGYALFDNNEVVGFLGMIFSDRLIDGSLRHFCNLSSWIVKEEYRDKSLSLILPILNLKSHTIIDFTPSRNVSLILRRLGFQELDSSVKVLLPFLWSTIEDASSDYKFTDDGCIIENHLNDNDLKIFYDHQPYQCKHLLVYNKKIYCYVIYSNIFIYNFRYSYILYINNKNLFYEINKNVRNWIVKKNRTTFIAVDSRFITPLKLPMSYNFPITSHKFYKSRDLNRDKIDNIYSELILLNIGTLPGLRSLSWDLLQLLHRLLEFKHHHDVKNRRRS